VRACTRRRCSAALCPPDVLRCAGVCVCVCVCVRERERERERERGNPKPKSRNLEQRGKGSEMYCKRSVVNWCSKEREMHCMRGR
jgi:hypothetical protein